MIVGCLVGWLLDWLLVASWLGHWAAGLAGLAGLSGRNDGLLGFVGRRLETCSLPRSTLGRRGRRINRLIINSSIDQLSLIGH